ncbi:hypothetical protein L917_06031 [Phytophthora nicotianae]|uniref:Uncharacterized protein n=1 Tax=Phytophthora nicotianae TaxID=4792 RepID=W2LGB2_PHYNI|nr:hypothetical protein L917_06031 [Phytophthora nicotianae]ETM49648.1 hypothetical protein L914_06151 [Phytophthora nicotianae]
MSTSRSSAHFNECATRRFPRQHGRLDTSVDDMARALSQPPVVFHNARELVNSTNVSSEKAVYAKVCSVQAQRATSYKQGQEEQTSVFHV